MTRQLHYLKILLIQGVCGHELIESLYLGHFLDLQINE